MFEWLKNLLGSSTDDASTATTDSTISEEPTIEPMTGSETVEVETPSVDMPEASPTEEMPLGETVPSESTDTDTGM